MPNNNIYEIDQIYLPAKALPIALNKAGLSVNDVDYYELNEAFSVVGLANIKNISLSHIFSFNYNYVCSDNA